MRNHLEESAFADAVRSDSQWNSCVLVRVGRQCVNWRVRIFLAVVVSCFGVASPALAASPATSAPPVAGALWGAVAVSPVHTWAVGSTTGADGTDTARAEFHSGGMWQAVPVPQRGTSAVLRAVDASGPDDVWAVGGGSNAGDAHTLPFADHWNGHTWVTEALPAPAPFGTFMYGVAETTPTDVWAVGTGPDALIVHRDSSGWTVAAQGPSQSALYAVTAASSKSAWAVGYRSDIHGGHPFAERWNGKLWSVVTVPLPSGAVAGRLRGTTAVSPNDVWAVGGYDYLTRSGGTLVEHWDGTSWSIVPSPSPSTGADAYPELNAVSATGPDDVWAVGTYFNSHTRTVNSMREHWDGTTWSLAPGPKLSTENLTAVAAGSTTHADAAGFAYPESSDETAHETWNGTAWHRT